MLAKQVVKSASEQSVNTTKPFILCYICMTPRYCHVCAPTAHMLSRPHLHQACDPQRQSHYQSVRAYLTKHELSSVQCIHAATAPSVILVFNLHMVTNLTYLRYEHQQTVADDSRRHTQPMHLKYEHQQTSADNSRRPNSESTNAH